MTEQTEQANGRASPSWLTVPYLTLFGAIAGVYVYFEVRGVQAAYYAVFGVTPDEVGYTWGTTLANAALVIPDSLFRARSGLLVQLPILVLLLAILITLFSAIVYPGAVARHEEKVQPDAGGLVSKSLARAQSWLLFIGRNSGRILLVLVLVFAFGTNLRFGYHPRFQLGFAYQAERFGVGVADGLAFPAGGSIPGIRAGETWRAFGISSQPAEATWLTGGSVFAGEYGTYLGGTDSSLVLYDVDAQQTVIVPRSAVQLVLLRDSRFICGDELVVLPEGAVCPTND